MRNFNNRPTPSGINAFMDSVCRAVVRDGKAVRKLDNRKNGLNVNEVKSAANKLGLGWTLRKNEFTFVKV